MVGVLALAVPAVSVAADGLATLPTNDVFRPAPCPIGEPADLAAHGIECGYLTAPENRSAPTGSSVELAVAWLHGTGPSVAPDPVLFLAGGPGGSALLGIGTWAGTTLRATHDVILLDQRGTGYSHPTLACPELLYPAGERESKDDFIAAHLRQARLCRDRLVTERVDLSAYNTNENAADVEDLRRALGIDRWNLYGISYGTRLALAVMRDYPAGVRSVVLDSAYPPQVIPLQEAGASADRAFDALVAACGAEPPCASAYPGLGTGFAEAIARFDRDFRNLNFDVPGHTISHAIFAWLYDTQQIELLPGLVHAAETGNAAVYFQAMEPTLLTAESRSDGMFLSVECSERAAFADPALIAADIAAHPRFGSYLERDWHPAACAEWGAGVANPADVAPVTSSIPTLLFAGELDPVTPPGYAELAASTLDHATLVRVPGAGHGVTLIHCPSDMRDAFVVDPAAPPDTTCLATMYGQRDRFFTDIVLNTGLPRILQEFSLNGPTIGHWMLAGFVALIFAIALVVWPTRVALAGIRRLRRHSELPAAAAAPPVDDVPPPPPDRPRPTSRLVRFARLIALVAIGLDIVVVAGIANGLSHIPANTILRNLGLLRADAWVLGVATIGGYVAIALVVVAVIAIVLRAGSWTARILLTLVAIAALIFSGTLLYYGLI